MTLRARLVRSLGPLRLDVDLDVTEGETVAIVGPNGAGKSTILRCLAGLLPLDDGRIELGGSVLDEPARSVFVPPERRPIGVVFQEHLLFPHLSAVENVAFGLRARGASRREARTQARAWLDRVGLLDHAEHRPGELSGGQSQRVALARALATDPQLLLLDEPLAALDAATRTEVRRDLRRHLGTFPGVRLLVTHDPVDAHALADRIVVVEGGRIVQSGRLAEVTARPRSRFVAELVGVNLLSGRGDGEAVVLDHGARLTVAEPVDGPTVAVIEPHAVALYAAPPAGSPRNVWHATVADVDRQGDRVRVRLEGEIPLVAEITAAALAALDLQPGGPVWASVKATEIRTSPA